MTRDIQRRLAALGVEEIVYQPGSFLEHRGPVLPHPQVASSAGDPAGDETDEAAGKAPDSDSGDSRYDRARGGSG